MKNYLKWPAVLLVVLTAFVLIPISSAQDDEDFISISPVDQKDNSTMMGSDTVEGKDVAAKPTPEPTEPPKAAVKPKPAEEKLASIEKILSLDLADRTEIRIITSAKVKYKATELAPPPNTRVLVQLSKCSVKGSTLEVGKNGIDKVRSAPHNSTAWVVIDMSEKMKWKARDDGEVIVIEVPKGSGAKVVADQGKQQLPPVAASGMIYRVLDVAGKDLGKKTRIIVTTDGPVKYRVKKDAENKKLTLNILEAVNIWDKGSFSMENCAVSTVNLKEDRNAKVVDLNLGLADNLPYTVSRDQNQIVIEVDNSAPDGKKRKKNLDIFQKISLNIQDASLPSVMRLLSIQTGFEFAISPSVTDTKPITIREDDQTLDQVLRDILIPQKLFYEVVEGIIKVGTTDELKAAKALMDKRAVFYYPKTMKAQTLKDLLSKQVEKQPLLDVVLQEDTSMGNNRLMIFGTGQDVDKVVSMISSIDAGGSTDTDGYMAGGLKTKIYKLNYIYPASVVNVLTPLLSTDGKIQVDDRSGNLIITDTSGYLKKIEGVIKKLDVKMRQVLIEAKLYEINVGAIKNIGVAWSGESSDTNPHIIGDVTGIPTSGAGQLFVGLLQNGININATLSALESNNKASLLSSPKIAVGDNSSANIDTTRTTYYQKQTFHEATATSPSYVTTEYQSIELPILLDVAAKITENENVMMKVNVTVTKILGAATGSAPPDTTTQKATTMVSANNNETVVIGGLITERVTFQEDKVPVLGDLPLLGNLFKGTKNQTEKVELVVFLTPSIVEE